MAEYVTPGVYWQDVFPPPQPPFLTGIPAFLGYARGSGRPGEDFINEPQLLTLWPHFAQLYGVPPDAGYLAYAVRGFFENGGFMCYVVRLNDGVDAKSALQDGLEAVAALESIDLVCAPDIMRRTSDPDSRTLVEVTELQRAVLHHCQALGNRFAILDTLNIPDVVGPAAATDTSAEEVSAPVSVQEQRQRLSSQYGAIYYPWLVVPDDAGNPMSVPPSGHVAGIYARSDQRMGVHKAPANEPLTGVLDVRRQLTESDVGQLNAMGVNSLRAFPGRGIRVWGARTLADDTDPTSNYVNVRRLFVTVSRWLERFMANVTFEANDIRLWMRIMREVSAYCDDLFRQGALKGRTAAEAFYVKCDSDTNPAEVIDTGMVVTEVGLAPIVPGEFIVVRIIHGDSGVNVEPVS